MTYASICSGIEAATVAWEPLGWRPAWFAEIDKFPSAVLAHHYPEIPNRGDFTQIQESEPIDLLVGGTPCQSFSVAGKRAGLDDPRGNLTLEWLALVARLRPRWLVWENVPGVLSDDGGRTFGTVLGTLGQLGYGFAYRVLDAQHFGVPQRRRRVFVVGCLGDWRRAAAVLFERHSLQGHPAPSREAGTSAAARAPGGIAQCHGSNVGEVGALRSGNGGVTGGVPFLATWFNARQDPIDSETCGPLDCDAFTNAVAFQSKASASQSMNPAVVAPSLDVGKSDGLAVAFNMRGREDGAQVELAPGNQASMRAGHGGASRSFVAIQERAISDGSSGPGGKGWRDDDQEARHRTQYVAFDETQITHPENRSNPQPDGPAALAASARPPSIAGPSVRRLTPRECERLQGFPDDYTLVIARRGKLAADGPRYKALGNSMPVPVMRWIGERIAMVNAL